MDVEQTVKSIIEVVFFISLVLMVGGAYYAFGVGAAAFAFGLWLLVIFSAAMITYTLRSIDAEKN